LNDEGAISDDVAEFMRGTRRAFMITLRKDGSPTCHPMAGFYGGGALYLNMYRASVKAKNLGRDDRICCVLATPYGAVFADEVPEGLAWARNPRSGGSQEKPEIPPEEERKIGDTAGRILRGKRTVFEVSPDQVGMIQDVREA